MTASSWTGRRFIVAIADAFDATPAQAAASKRAVAKGSRAAVACLIVSLALPLSAVPRVVGSLSMNSSLLVALGVLVTFTAAVWPLLGIRSDWRVILGFTTAAGLTSSAVLFLMRASAFDGLPAGTGGDAGNHVRFLHQFVASVPGTYDGMVSMYAVAHWLTRARLVDEIGMFRVIWQVAIVACFSVAAGFALSSAQPAFRAGRILRVVQPTLIALSLAAAASFVALPLIHYYQGDGFLAQVFSLAPLAVGGATYAVASRRIVRCFALIATLGVCRFTYVLNAGDLSFASAVLFFLEMREGPRRGSVRALLFVAGAAALGLGVVAYVRLSALTLVDGGFFEAPLLPQLIGLGTLSLVLAAIGPISRRFGATLPAASQRLTRFLAVICGMPTLLVTLWLLAGGPVTYYIQKYAFCAIIVGCLWGPPIALGAGFSIWKHAKAPLARAAAVALCSFTSLGVFALSRSAAVYAPSFHERLAGPPYRRIEPHAERAVWSRIAATLQREGARFGGFLTPRWPELQFTNAHFEAPDYYNLHDGGVVERRGYCVFWYENKRLPRSLRARWSEQARAKVAALQASRSKTCSAFIPRSAPEQRFSLCSLCFHGTSRQLDLAQGKAGFHDVEHGAHGTSARWTNGDGRIDVTLSAAEAERSCTVDVLTSSTAPFVLLLDDHLLGDGPRQKLPINEGLVSHELAIRSPTFVPAQNSNSDDGRQLGVQVSGITIECSDEARLR